MTWRVIVETFSLRALRRALHLKKLAERLQKEHPKSWRFQKWAKRTRAKWLRRAKNALIDSAHYLAKRLVRIAEELRGLHSIRGLEEGQRRQQPRRTGVGTTAVVL
jgi:putative transposase